jgi:predicted patatin/cPLA2 family phospholipase
MHSRSDSSRTVAVSSGKSSLPSYLCTHAGHAQHSTAQHDTAQRGCGMQEFVVGGRNASCM